MPKYSEFKRTVNGRTMEEVTTLIASSADLPDYAMRSGTRANLNRYVSEVNGNTFSIGIRRFNQTSPVLIGNFEQVPAGIAVSGVYVPTRAFRLATSWCALALIAWCVVGFLEGPAKMADGFLMALGGGLLILFGAFFVQRARAGQITKSLDTLFAEHFSSVTGPEN